MEGALPLQALQYAHFHNEQHGHSYGQCRFRMPSRCAACAQIIWNIKGDGVKCLTCELPAHRKCVMDPHVPSCSDTLQARQQQEQHPQDGGGGGGEGGGARAKRFVRVGIPVVAGTVVGGVLGGPVGAAAMATTGAKIFSLANVAGAGLGAYGANRWREKRETSVVGQEDPVWASLHADFTRQLLAASGGGEGGGGGGDGGDMEEEEDARQWGGGPLQSSLAARRAARSGWSASERQFFEGRDLAAPGSAEAVGLFVARALQSPVSPVGQYRAELAQAFADRESGDQVVSDAHAVVHRLAVAVLQAYPPLQDSETATTAAMSAAQDAAFSVVYAAVMREMRRVCADEDAALRARLAEVRERPAEDDAELRAAVDMLQRVSSATSAGAKMRLLTKSLELASAAAQAASGEAAGADVLLPMICRTVALADLPAPASEMAFILDFGDADALLRGREGYSVTTFQAALQIVLQPELVELF